MISSRNFRNNYYWEDAHYRQYLVFFFWLSPWISLVAQMVKRLPTMQEIQVQSLDWEPLEKEMTIQSSTFAWKIPWTEEHGRLQPMGLQRVGHDWATSLSRVEVKISIISPSHGLYLYLSFQSTLLLLNPAALYLSIHLSSNKFHRCLI